MNPAEYSSSNLMCIRPIKVKAVWIGGGFTHIVTLYFGNGWEMESPFYSSRKSAKRGAERLAKKMGWELIWEVEG